MTPRSIGLAAALHSPEAKERLAGEAAEPVGSSPEEFGQFIRAEIARWGRWGRHPAQNRIDACTASAHSR